MFKYFILALCLSALNVSAMAQQTHRQIAITFDDAPTADTVIFSGRDRSNKIIEHLASASVKHAAFFVTTQNINASTKPRLERYVKSGFVLANHSHSHRSANKVSQSDYVEDVKKAKLLLSQFESVRPFHRFPYLHYGRDKQAIESLQTELNELGYRNGYVTIDNFEWYINSVLIEAKKSGKAINWQAAEKLYVEVLWQSIQHYDALAQELLGRSPKHVLLLHENDSAALFLPALLDKLKDEGWHFISIDDAYSDPIAQTFPSVKQHNQGRISALADEKGLKGARLRHKYESEEALDKLFETMRVFHE